MSDPTTTNDDNWPTEHLDDELVSKTELKRQSALRQKLGAQLVDLTQAHLNTIPMDEDLAEAVNLARSINRKKDGFRRQLQFIGKILRSIDIQPIEEALAKLNHQHQAQNAAFHQLEKAREAIISQGDKAIQELLEEHPSLDRQKLRQFHRSIKKEREKNAPPKAFRELFQYLKSVLED